jgi:hypothetical protein
VIAARTALSTLPATLRSWPRCCPVSMPAGSAATGVRCRLPPCSLPRSPVICITDFCLKGKGPVRVSYSANRVPACPGVFRGDPGGPHSVCHSALPHGSRPVTITVEALQRLVR